MWNIKFYPSVDIEQLCKRGWKKKKKMYTKRFSNGGKIDIYVEQRIGYVTGKHALALAKEWYWDDKIILYTSAR